MIPWRDIVHYAIDAGLALFLWKGIVALTRFTNLLRDYPLHRHENGLIVYPPDFAPGKVEEIHGSRNS